MADTWFHATPDGGRIGPMRADDLVRLFQAGRLHASTPVWREGMAEWAPLSSMAPALGLPAMPPPLPRAAVLPPRRGLHWSWIVLLVLAGLAVPVLAILAAIALPAYNDYRVRSGVVEVAASAAPLQLAVQAAQATGSPCPITTSSHVPGADRAAFSNADVDAARTTLLAHPRVESVLTTQGTLDVDAHAADPGDHCEITLRLQGFELAAIDGEMLTWWLDPASGHWTCGGTVAARYLPVACRN
ncbi:GYF domain-containing protein [Luteimonas sp. 3794]|uniref:GYF domain-containing protein n=1 Tax=Luteimonas sp. 3794 TaxID=2817730 RepID=UPI00285AE638|nr:GYF domain-containing protein [Luteimonas sp. 3794]MDR6991934.1 type IV pilus assembly protein PilA [Luteimonas sp. 3794]